MIAVWVGVLLASVWLAHWGAEHLSDPLKKLRRQWGFSVAAGGAFVGLVSDQRQVLAAAIVVHSQNAELAAGPERVGQEV